ncbi:MAG: DNA polymerase III subunit gamma/tau, partial [Clostridiales bacterium]|nr:DNA polymerase III subunit gamma/tau [Clostridiales bacterium]
MYQALYRKYRPKTFDDVIGQEHITDILKAQVVSGRLSHAYLFVGTKGTGKTTCARILAKAVNCKNPQSGNPCNECEFCKGIDDGSILDVIEIDAASNNKVEDARALRTEALYSPANTKKRVYIIDEVHSITPQAFGALLKIMEEPPEHLIFILATTELHRVPATILSRCQRHSFHRIAADLITKSLSEIAGRENIDLSIDAARLIARLSDGSMRDALSMLDQCSGSAKIDKDYLLETLGILGNRESVSLLRAMCKKDLSESLNLYRSFLESGKTPQNILSELSSVLRDIFIMKVSKKKAPDLISGKYSIEELNYFLPFFSESKLLFFLNKIQESIYNMKLLPFPLLSAEILIISLLASETPTDASDLSVRVDILEQKLDSLIINNKEVRNITFNEKISSETINFENTSEEIENYDDNTNYNEPETRSSAVDISETFAVPEISADFISDISWDKILAKASESMSLV